MRRAALFCGAAAWILAPAPAPRLPARAHPAAVYDVSSGVLELRSFSRIEPALRAPAGDRREVAVFPVAGAALAAAFAAAGAVRRPLRRRAVITAPGTPRLGRTGLLRMGVSRKAQTPAGFGKSAAQTQGKGRGRKKGGKKPAESNGAAVPASNGAEPDSNENDPLAEARSRADAGLAPQQPDMDAIQSAVQRARVGDGERVTVQLAGCDAVFPLAAPELLADAGPRVGSLAAPPSYDEVLAALQGVEEDDAAISNFVQANRDLLDYRFLYRLTSMKLRADNSKDATASNAYQAARLRAVKGAQGFDSFLYREVVPAEQRLAGVLGKFAEGQKLSASQVVGASGSTPAEFFAFWFVTVAAIAAWESKLKVQAVAAKATAKLQELEFVRSAIEEEGAGRFRDESGVGVLAPLIRLPNLAFADPASGAFKTARATLEEIAPESTEALALVRRVGCMYCQAQRQKYKAYQPLVEKTAALYDVLLRGGLKGLEPVDTKMPERDLTKSDSLMVQTSMQADATLKRDGVEIPLYW